MYVVVQHQIKDPQTAFSRGEKLIKNEGAPEGVRGLQFYPSTDGSAVTACGRPIPSSDPAVRRLDARGLQREHLLRGRRRAGVRGAAARDFRRRPRSGPRVPLRYRVPRPGRLVIHRHRQESAPKFRFGLEQSSSRRLARRPLRTRCSRLTPRDRRLRISSIASVARGRSGAAAYASKEQLRRAATELLGALRRVVPSASLSNPRPRSGRACRSATRPSRYVAAGPSRGSRTWRPLGRR